jgi:hypothetical protein
MYTKALRYVLFECEYGYKNEKKSNVWFGNGVSAD